MLVPKHVIIPIPTPGGGADRVWFDTGFDSLRLLDGATHARMRAFAKARIALMLGLLLPATIAIAGLFLFVERSQEYIVFLVFAVVLVDLASRVLFALAERRTLGATPLHPIAEARRPALRDALKRRNLAALQQAAAPLVAEARCAPAVDATL